MATDMAAFTPALMAALPGCLPVTQGRIDWCQHWANGEGTNALYNPFATTLPGLEDSTNPYWNSFTIPGGAVLHVRNYRDLTSGVQQTATTIQQSNFALILRSLQTQRVQKGVAEVMRSTWGTTAFADELVSGWTPTGWTSDYVIGSNSSPLPAFTEEQIQTIDNLIDTRTGALILLYLRQILGIDVSTFTDQATVDAIRDRLLGAHHHETGEPITSSN